MPVLWRSGVRSVASLTGCCRCVAGVVRSSDILSEISSAIYLVGASIRIVYFEKIRVFNAGFNAVNILAWNNKIGLRLHWLAAGLGCALRCAAPPGLTVAGFYFVGF